MTNLEALKATVAGYPIRENTFLKALLDRGVASTDAYTGMTKAFELATADVYMILATAANISEGGFTVSVSDKEAFLEQAKAIFKKYDEPKGPQNSVENASFRW